MVMIGTLVATQLFTQGVGYSLQLGTNRLGGDLLVVPVGTQDSAETYLITGTPQAFYMNESVLQQVEADSRSRSRVATDISNEFTERIVLRYRKSADSWNRPYDGFYCLAMALSSSLPGSR